MESKCCHCQTPETERELTKCVICYRYFCKECEHDRNGRRFCSKACADFFFFGDED